MTEILARFPKGELFIFLKDLAEKTEAMAKSRSLSWRLGILTLVIVLPLVVFALMMVGWIAYADREAIRKALVDDAFGLADDVAREINPYFLLSAALSHSSFLQRGDLTGFAQQARDILAEAPGVTLIVSTADGHPILSIPPLASYSPLLRDRAALVLRAIESDSAFLSDVSSDPALPEAYASIETPVSIDGKPVYEIAMIFRSNNSAVCCSARTYRRPGCRASSIVRAHLSPGSRASPELPGPSPARSFATRPGARRRPL